jgi:UrcA family protein
MRSKIHMLLFSTLVVAASQFAMAGTAVTVKTEVVRYDDVRIISAVGAAVLYSRIRAAAERACGGPVDSLQLARKTRHQACVDEAVAKAVADVNNSMLTWYYDSKRGASTQHSDSTAPNNNSAVAKAR